MFQPLSEVFRPKALDEVVGQEHLVGPSGLLSSIIKAKKPLSILFWGPPGSGKTTLAKLYAASFSYHFVCLSAVASGVTHIKKIIEEKEKNPLFSKGTILFIDEIHRFNKAQQDLFLPYMEKGFFVVVGATTENPSFALNSALLSRLRVLPVKPLDYQDLEKLLDRYEAREGALMLEKEAKDFLLEACVGDGRYLFNLIENIKSLSSSSQLSLHDLKKLLQTRAPLYDKEGDAHYNLISALHKSVRGSDPDAALYWLCRMLKGGEEPLYIMRRLIRMAIEDIGLADPDALKICLYAKEAYEMLGSPEGELALAEATIYLALAPKSNALYEAFNEAMELAEKTSHMAPPSIILNAPTALMKEMGYGKGYQYDHEMPLGFSGQDYFPTNVERQAFYKPAERGFEREMKKRVEYFEKLRGALQENEVD